MRGSGEGRPRVRAGVHRGGGVPLATLAGAFATATSLAAPGASLAAQSAPLESPRLAELAAAVARDPAALDRFWTRLEREGTPLIEPSGVEDESILTFIHRAPPEIPVRLTAPIWALSIEGLPDFDTVGLLDVLPGTDVHYASYRVRDELRLSYEFDVGEGDDRETVRDPLNPLRYLEGTRFEESAVELPDAPPQPWAGTATPGEWREHPMESEALDGSLTVRVYRPRGAADSRSRSEPHAVLLGMDATAYADLLPTARVVEHLMERGEIPPTLVVTTPDLAWVGDDFGSYERAATFLVDELLPLLRREYDITDSPHRVVASGLSRRGMVSAYVAFHRPEAVARVLSLSGSYYWRPPGHPEFEWVPSRFAEEPRRDIRLYLAAGELETVVTPTNRGHYLVATNRHMRDVLRAKGYEHRYTEFYGVHSTFNWQDELAPGLVYLLGGG